MISSHKILKIKWFLTTKQNQNHPILEWIPMKLALHSSKTNDYIHNLILKTNEYRYWFILGVTKTKKVISLLQQQSCVALVFHWW
uniref:Uncharacterized protein n=1 Tax=Pseudonaja textilis TaxID=8673 RepID=A0A670ZPV4_PSETE